jgi:hypothetical protein
MNIYEECRECNKKMRAFKRNQIKKQRREIAGIIAIMVLVFGYLIWQVNRNLEPNLIEVINPVYTETIQGTDQILTEYSTVGSDGEIEGSGYISMGLPEDADGSFKTYMDYEKITNKSSRQWHLQQLAYTDSEGFRKFNDSYLVAVGTYYADEVGKEFRITLDSGIVFHAMVGDIKQDIHTDANNQYVTMNGNIVEFIVDVDKLNELTRDLGNVSNSGLEGSIIKIEEVVR